MITNNFNVLFEIHSGIFEDIKIIEKETRNDEGSERVVFKTILQTANEINANKRYYSKEICKKITESLQPLAKSRSLLQEIDHPFLNTSDTDLQKKRAITIDYKNCGSMIRNIYMENDKVIGEIQTLSGFHGPSLRDLIVKDKVSVGFSLRMLGQIKQHPTYEGVSCVVDPIRPITYDIVTNPSHKSAKIVSFLPESINSFIDNEYDIINENELLMFENLNPPIKSHSLINEYLTDILNEEFKNIKTLKFNF